MEQIGVSLRHARRKLNFQRRLRQASFNGAIVNGAHRLHRTVAQVKRIRPVIEILDVIGQEVRPPVVSSAVCMHGTDQFMDADSFHERELLVPKSVEMLEVRLILNKPAQNC